jgi:hypothetical protein
LSEIDSVKFLDTAEAILEGGSMLDANTGKIVKLKEKRLSLAKMINPDRKEFIAVMIFKGTQKEIEEMYHNH